MPSKYKRIVENVFEDTDCMLNGDIDNVIKHLQKLKTKYSSYSNLEISLDAGYNNISMEVVGYRQETDSERNDRLAKEKMAKQENIKKLANKKLKIIQEAKKLGLKLSE